MKVKNSYIAVVMLIVFNLIFFAGIYYFGKKLNESNLKVNSCNVQNCEK